MLVPIYIKVPLKDHLLPPALYPNTMLQPQNTCIFIAVLSSVKFHSVYGQQALPQCTVLYRRAMHRWSGNIMPCGI